MSPITLTFLWLFDFVGTDRQTNRRTDGRDATLYRPDTSVGHTTARPLLAAIRRTTIAHVATRCNSEDIDVQCTYNFGDIWTPTTAAVFQLNMRLQKTTTTTTTQTTTTTCDLQPRLCVCVRDCIFLVFHIVYIVCCPTFWWIKFNTKRVKDPYQINSAPSSAGAFLAAAVWGGQRGSKICIWGPRIPDDIMHDRVNGVIWHQLCDATL